MMVPGIGPIHAYATSKFTIRLVVKCTIVAEKIDFERMDNQQKMTLKIPAISSSNPGLPKCMITNAKLTQTVAQVWPTLRTSPKNINPWKRNSSIK